MCHLVEYLISQKPRTYYGEHAKDPARHLVEVEDICFKVDLNISREHVSIGMKCIDSKKKK